MKTPSPKVAMKPTTPTPRAITQFRKPDIDALVAEASAALAPLAAKYGLVVVRAPKS